MAYLIPTQTLEVERKVHFHLCPLIRDQWSLGMLILLLFVQFLLKGLERVARYSTKLFLPSSCLDYQHSCRLGSQLGKKSSSIELQTFERHLCNAVGENSRHIPQVTNRLNVGFWSNLTNENNEILEPPTVIFDRFAIGQQPRHSDCCPSLIAKNHDCVGSANCHRRL